MIFTVEADHLSYVGLHMVGLHGELYMKSTLLIKVALSFVKKTILSLECKNENTIKSVFFIEFQIILSDFLIENPFS